MSQQPIPYAGIEVLDALPMKGVTGLFIKMEFTVWDGPGYFFGHPYGRKNILPPAND